MKENNFNRRTFLGVGMTVASATAVGNNFSSNPGSDPIPVNSDKGFISGVGILEYKSLLLGYKSDP